MAGAEVELAAAVLDPRLASVLRLRSRSRRRARLASGRASAWRAPARLRVGRRRDVTRPAASQATPSQAQHAAAGDEDHAAWRAAAMAPVRFPAKARSARRSSGWQGCLRRRRRARGGGGVGAGARIWRPWIWGRHGGGAGGRGGEGAVAGGAVAGECICLSTVGETKKNALFQLLYTEGNFHLPLQFASSLLESV